MDMLAKLQPANEKYELSEVERSTSPDAPMNLLLRFDTANGPRTVIACSVPLATAREIGETMSRAGQHAEFVDRCAPLSIADRLMMKKLEDMQMQDMAALAFQPRNTQVGEISAFSIAAE
ncbi:MAG: hypothetical protein V4601_04410 [Pseudomonadota bacterium]